MPGKASEPDGAKAIDPALASEAVQKVKQQMESSFSNCTFEIIIFKSMLNLKDKNNEAFISKA